MAAQFKFQFSLRAFLLLCTALCCVVFFVAHRVQQQRKFVAWLREKGVDCYYDVEFEEEPSGIRCLLGSFDPNLGWNLKGVWLHGTEHDVEVLRAIAKHPHITCVLLWGEGIDSAVIAALCECHHVDNVRFRSVNALDDKSILTLSRMPKLRLVELERTRVSADGMDNLQAVVPQCTIVYYPENQGDYVHPVIWSGDRSTAP